MAQQMHAQLAAPPLRLLSLNPNGLRDHRKRRAVLGAFMRGPWHVLCLQELHAASGDELLQWAREGAGQGMPLRGTFYANPHSSVSAGVAVLIKASAPVESSRAGAAPNGGRLQDVVLQYAGREVSLVNCYAPAVGAERPAFFQTQLPAVLPEGRAVLAVGDWNHVSDPRDVVGGVQGGGRFQGSAQFEAVAVERGLVDAWRHLHPAQVGLTHTASNGTGSSSARLDRWYASSDILPWVRECEIVEGLQGDHLGVSITLAPEAPLPCGAGRWRLPLHLLQDKKYCQELASTAQDFLADHPVGGGVSAGQRWEGLKAHMTHFSIAYDLGARAAASRRRRKLLHAVHAAQRRYAQHPGVPGHLQAYERARQVLQLHDSQAAEQRAAAASVLWHCYGERPTKWFHTLGRGVQPLRPLPGVRNPADREAEPASMGTAAGRQAAKEHALAFFSADSPSGLFRPPPTDPAAQAELLAVVDKFLSPTAAAATLGPAGDGSITGDEVKELFKALPRGVSPGLDGLPYEFYLHFWEVLGPAFADMANEALAAGEGAELGDQPALPRSMLMGLIVLLYKGGDKDPCDLASYRPITLLNCDYRLLARLLCARFAGPLSSVVDVTQTAFLPGRWIGDNVLYHMEEVAYLEEAGQVGCIVFLDFEKAYDRCERGWLYQVMERMGFPEPAVRWVRIMLAGTRAKVSLNGFYTLDFPVRSSVQQGSPLSVLLFNITVQPMAAHMRQLQAQGALQPIALPDGSPAPPCHQHADDTSLHVRSPADVAVALGPGGSVGLHERASGAKVHPDKSKGLCFGPHPELDPATRVCGACGVRFPSPQEPIRHLGIFLGTDAEAAHAQTFGRLYQNVRDTAALWRQHKLSWLGRAYIAKQVLAAQVSYHITFVPAPAHLWRLVSSIISAFIAGAEGTEGEGGGGVSHPSLAVTALPWEEGGISRVDLGIQGECLQGKVGARLLHPARHPWKVLMQERLRAALPALGAAVLVSGLQVSATQLRDRRLLAYVRGFQLTCPHRLVLPPALSPAQLGVERLFHNRQIQRAGQQLRASAHQELVTAGVLTVAQLAAVVNGAQPAPPAALWVWECVPESWRARVVQEGEGGWQLAAALGVVRGADGAQFDVREDGMLLEREEPLAGPLAWEPCCVVGCPLQPRDPRSPSVPFLLGPWSDVQVDPSVWGWGEQPLPAFTVKAAAVRQVQMRAAAKGDGWYAVGVGRRPKLWDPPAGAPGGSEQHSGLQRMETLWQHDYEVAVRQASSRGRAGGRRAAEFQVEVHPCQRLGQRQPRAGVWTRVAARKAAGEAGAGGGGAAARLRRRAAPSLQADDTKDAAAKTEPASEAERTTHAAVRGVWARLRAADLPREQYSTAYRILHGKLYVGGFLCHIGALEEPGLACCTHADCGGVLETLTHAFLTCPAVAPVAPWVCQVFAAAAGGPAPPATAAVLLADNWDGWQPPEGTAQLWTSLRAAFLHTVWQQRCQRSLAGREFTAAGVCAAVVAAVRAAIQRDWARVTQDLVGLSGAPREWFRGRDPTLKLDSFRERWGQSGALYMLEGGDGWEGRDAEGEGEEEGAEGEPPRLVLRLSLGHPVPAPAAPPGAGPSPVQSQRHEDPGG